MSLVDVLEPHIWMRRFFSGLLCGLCLLCLSPLAFAGLLSESFEGDFPPSGWVSFTDEITTAGWIHSDTMFGEWGYSAQTSTAVPDTLPVHQWLITPPLRPDPRNASVSFSLRCLPAPFTGTDSLYLLVSSRTTNPADFTDTLLTIALSELDTNGLFVPFFAGFSAFANDTIYLAFVFAQQRESTTVFLDGVTGPPLCLPVVPSDPYPPDSSAGIGNQTALSWVNGLGTLSIDLYFSRSEAAVQSLSSATRVLTGAVTDTYQPVSNLIGNRAYFWRIVAHGEESDTIGPVWRFTPSVGPLAGAYSIGTAGDFVSFGDALSMLATAGISASTDFAVRPGVYAEFIALPAIAGASETSPLEFRRAKSDSSVTISCINTTDTCAVIFLGASFITLDGIDVIVSGGSAKHGVVLNPESSHNTIRNAIVNGPGAAVTGSSGIFLRGANADGNRFDSVTVRRTARGFYLESPAGTACRNNLVENCATDSVRCGAYLLRQASCHVSGCRFVVNAGSYEEVDGMYVGTTLPGDSVFLHENQISGMTTSGAYAVGIRVKTDSANAVVRADNNMIYDFRNTGTSQVRALYLSSGQCELLSNSILVNDVSATGAAYAVYLGALGAAGKTILKNNIFSNREATAIAYNVFAFSTTALLESDYNIFYGTGSNYRLGRWGTDCTTLATWQAAAGTDARSFIGDPGFISSTDLHLASSSGLAHQNGAVISSITRDIDGDARLIPPDRGADEYVYNAPAADFALFDFFDLAASYVESTVVSLRVVVHNRGSAMQRGVPVRLFCNDSLQGEWYTTLMPLELDTVTLLWSTPAGDSVYTLRAQCFLDGDAVPANDSLTTTMQVVRPPLTGDFTIGDPDGPYPDFSSAVQDLADRGITEPVTFEIAPGNYAEQIVIPVIPGASEANRVIFRPAASRGVVTISSDTGPATIVLNGADYTVLDGLNVIATGSNNEAIRLTDDADGNLITNVTLTGPSLMLGTAVGVHAIGGNNDSNTVSNLSIQGFYYGVRLEAASVTPDRGNQVENCTIINSRTGIRSDYQDSARVVSNTIHTGYDGALVACQGIYVNHANAGSVVWIEGNLLTGGRGAASVCGIYLNMGSGTAAVVNNMLCGWNVGGTGTIYGILAASGQAAVHFNSLWMNDVSGTGDVIAIADTGTSAAVTARNNAIQISEHTNPSWFYYRSVGALNCDYAAFADMSNGNSLLKTGRWGTTDYTTLAQWRTATNMDSHSLSGDPGFMDSLNLHIQVHIPLLDTKGVAVAGITNDFDKDPRSDPPDIGADEYVFGIYERNLLVQWLAPPSGPFAAQTEYSIPILVSNVGWLPQDNVPLRLFYRDSVVSESLIALIPSETDTIIMNWLTPTVDLEQGTLRVQAFPVGDQVPDNDSVSAWVTIYGSPLAGSYDCGGGNGNFISPLHALTHLSLRGISDSVNIRVYQGTYADSLYFSTIAGATPERRIKFSGIGSEPAAAVLTASSGEAVVRLNGTDYLTLENLSVHTAGSCSTAVFLTGGANGNIFRDCIFSGSDSANSNTVGIRIKTDGNDSNRVEYVTISGSFMGVEFQGGASGTQGRGNVIRRSTICHARYGIYVSRQVDCLIDANDIQPGFVSTNAAACYGIYVTTLGTGGNVTVCGNKIHDFTDSSSSTSNRAVGIYAAAGAGASVMAYNNFIYGFEHIYGLKISAIYLSSGENIILHNSVLVDDAPTANEIAAVYISTGTSHVLKNNILVSRETNIVNYGILQTGGSGLICDGNDIWSASSNFTIARISGTNYSSLASWQAAGYDLNGMSANPAFQSDDDLHILDTVATIDGRGVVTGIVMTDIDGEARAVPPDIGADEYSVLPPPPIPSALTIYAEEGGVRLIWRSVAEAGSYHIYSDSSFSFSATTTYQVGITADTTFLLILPTDSFAFRYFVVTADRRPMPVSLMMPDSSYDILPAAVRRE
jgi:hypothetical protein